MNGYAARLQESRIQEFHYRLPWRSQAVHPGYHQGVQPGPGQDFRAYEPLFRHPDARRLDRVLSAGLWRRRQILLGRDSSAPIEAQNPSQDCAREDSYLAC
ncbi:MAG: hypothetical protein ACREYE_29030, partial [Gammaproteobacteria bacterium]